MRIRTVVLLSGGLDSAVNLKQAEDETDVLLVLTFDYGQKAASREIDAARAMCGSSGADHKVVDLPWLAEITQTALVSSDRDLPRPSGETLDDPEESSRRAASVWVPNRNGAFVAIGASFAESLGADAVVAGFNAEEGRAFPDNSMEFISAFNRVLVYSTLNGVKLVSYTAALDKVEIVRMGLEIGAPLENIWSCYDSGPAHCGRCESCLRLMRAFDSAGAGNPFSGRTEGHA